MKKLYSRVKLLLYKAIGFHWRETYIYYGDGVAPPEIGELVGAPYTDRKRGLRGVVAENSHLTITVEFRGTIGGEE